MKQHRAIWILTAVLLIFVLPTFAADPLVKFRKGVEFYEAGKFADAQKKFSEFIAEHPYEAEVRKAWYYLAVTAAAQGNSHEAITRANITLERYPGHADRLELKVLTAECLYRVDAHARAEKTLQDVFKQIKDNTLRYRAEKTLGFIRHDARLKNEAAVHLKNALRLRPKNAAADADLLKIHKLLGEIYAEDPMQVEAAALHLQSAIELADAQKSAEAKSLRILLQKISLRRIDKLNGLSDNSIADIRVDGDDIYVATWGGGLVRYLRSQDKLEKIRLPSPQLRGLYVDFDEIYVTSFDGVYRISKKSGKVSALSDDSGELKLGQKTIKDDRHIYFSTLNRGLIQYDTIKKKVVTLGKDSWVKSNQVYAIDADVEYIAVGTLDQGALLHNKKTKETVQITAGEGALRSENVKAVLLDGRYVYIGAHNDGVYVYDIAQKKLTRLNAELPFPSAFARREHEIFIGTSGQGIRVLNRNDMSIERLSAVEGLSSNEVQILRVEGDFLWIGYLENGIDVVFRPQREK
ncbi:MAG: tetratricopeptide repeat protein [Leptospiraceae bacterium]|nr:tetratricopeptide repeat protein [Leptospiraceae bacterium]